MSIVILNMKTIICFALVVSISAAKDGDVYVYNGRDYYSNNPVTKPKPCSVFTFGYHTDDMLSMQIYLKNLAPNLSADINLKYSSGVTMDKKQRDIYKGEKYFEFHLLLNSSKIFVELELSTAAGFCTSQKIVIGTDVTGIPAEKNDTPYNDICLRDESCVVEVDLLKYICENVKTTSNSLIIISSLSGVAFVLLAIIAVWKRCWIKRSPRGRPVLATNQNTEPFYLNMLFRRQCDEEIVELDQHHYEEISPRDCNGT